MKAISDLSKVEKMSYHPKINRVGETYGDLTILEYIGKIKKKNGLYAQWVVKCECSCGSLCYFYIGDVMNSDSKNCGCVRRIKLSKKKQEIQRVREDVAILRRFNSAKKRVEIKYSKILKREAADKIKDEKMRIKHENILRIEIARRDRNNITYERLHKVLDYDPIAGEFTWKKHRKYGGNVGAIAGHRVKRTGYVVIGIDGLSYMSHRLVWLYTYGYLPENQLDHINRVKHDNRLTNLREVSPACNLRNKNVYACNKSGVTGVRFDVSSERWISTIGVDSKLIKLGIFDEFVDAVKARWAAEIEYGYTTCCMESASYKYLKDNNLLG